MTDTLVTTEEKRKWYTRIPNIVDDMNLDPYAFRLYAHLRRVAGDEGACWQCTDTLSKHCKMSEGAVSKAKQALVEADLIRIEKKKRNGTYYHHITIIDIWAKNFAAFASAEKASSPDESAPSPGETKKNPIKNDTPTAGDTRPGVPRSFGEWVDLIKDSKNKVAVVRWLCMTLYPDKPEPEFGWVGTVIKRVDGPERLAQLLWQSNTYRVTGDPLKYCLGIAKGQPLMDEPDIIEVRV